MAQNLRGGDFALQGLEDVEVLLLDAHGIDATRHAAVLARRVAPQFHHVRPAEHRPAGVVLRGFAVHAVAPEVAPPRVACVGARDILLCLVVRVEIILAVAAPQPAVDVVEIRRREVVPHAARRLLAAELGLHHRDVSAQRLHRRKRACVESVDHRADILRLRDLIGLVQRATAHEASAMRIVLFLQKPHLAHVRGRNLIVARLPEEDGRRIAVVDDDVPHRRDALLPVFALRFALLVAGGAGYDNAHLVAGAHRVRLGGDVHPADVVRVRFTNERHFPIHQPVGRQTNCRPAVNGALRIAGEREVLAVDEQPPFLEIVLDLAEARADRLGIEDIPRVVNERHRDIIEMRRIRRPEDKPRRAPRFAVKRLAVHREADFVRRVARDFRFDMEGCCALLKVKVLRPDIGADGTERAVERQGQIRLARLDVQLHVSRQPSLHGIERRFVPLVVRAALACRAAVGLDFDFVLALLDCIGQIEPTGRDPRIVEAAVLAIDAHARRLPDGFDFEKVFS